VGEYNIKRDQNFVSKDKESTEMHHAIILPRKQVYNSQKQCDHNEVTFNCNHIVFVILSDRFDLFFRWECRYFCYYIIAYTRIARNGCFIFKNDWYYYVYMCIYVYRYKYIHIYILGPCTYRYEYIHSGSIYMYIGIHSYVYTGFIFTTIK
jgi:hypothetical protein